jgi:hypothetical protein
LNVNISKKRFFAIFLFIIFIFLSYSQENSSNDKNESIIYEHSIAIKPIDLFVDIYAFQYEKQFDEKNELILGAYYLLSNGNNAYPGTFELITPMIGYRRYLWEELHIEYILMPGCALYKNNTANIQSFSFEIWNEFHIGYRFQFSLFKIPLFITPQALIGFNLYRGNQPLSFRIIDEDPNNFFPNILYLFPNINMGFRF